MAIRKQRKVRTADKLYEPPKVVKEPPVFGGFNKYVRQEGMRDRTSLMLVYDDISSINKIPLFVSPKHELPEQLDQMFADVVPIYGLKPKVLTGVRGKLPNKFEADPYAKEWADDTLLWSAATKTTFSTMDSLFPDPGPPGNYYALVLAAVQEEIGLALVRGKLTDMHRVSFHSLLAAREPGNQGGLRIRGVSPVLRRLHRLADRYLTLSTALNSPLDIERILPDERNYSDLDSAFGDE